MLFFLMYTEDSTILNETVHFIKGQFVNSAVLPGKLQLFDRVPLKRRTVLGLVSYGAPLLPGRSVRPETGGDLLDRPNALAERLYIVVG